MDAVSLSAVRSNNLTATFCDGERGGGGCARNATSQSPQGSRRPPEHTAPGFVYAGDWRQQPATRVVYRCSQF
jgi:hypothetical protein